MTRQSHPKLPIGLKSIYFSSSEAEGMKIDQIIRTKRRTIALIINHDGTLIIRAPLRTTQKQIEDLVAIKAEWIKSKQKLIKATYARFVPKEYINGEEFLYLGIPYTLSIVDDSVHPLHLGDHFYLSHSVLDRADKIFKGWYREQAKKVIIGRVKEYADLYRFEYRKVNITNAQTRWGSCSPCGNLNFSWRVVMAPMPVINYVIVHELIHLREKNHSRRFWDKVKNILPGYTQQVQWLKNNGHLLRLT
jgi:predicted metal-dependent hydrolase